MKLFLLSFSMLNLLDVVTNIGCSGTASEFDDGESYSVKCTFSCGGSVYGCPKNNGWVSSDSSICLAAKMLAIRSGSPFTLVRAGQQDSYESCTMNGYTSNSYGSWAGSYRIETSKASSFK